MKKIISNQIRKILVSEVRELVKQKKYSVTKSCELVSRKYKLNKHTIRYYYYQNLKPSENKRLISLKKRNFQKFLNKQVDVLIRKSFFERNLIRHLPVLNPVLVI